MPWLLPHGLCTDLQQGERVTIVCFVAVRLWGGCTVHALWNQPGMAWAHDGHCGQDPSGWELSGWCSRHKLTDMTLLGAEVNPRPPPAAHSFTMGPGEWEVVLDLIGFACCTCRLFSSPLKLFIPTQTPEGPATAVAWCGPTVVSIISVSSGGWHV